MCWSLKTACNTMAQIVPWSHFLSILSAPLNLNLILLRPQQPIVLANEFTNPFNLELGVKWICRSSGNLVSNLSQSSYTLTSLSNQAYDFYVQAV